MRLEAFRGRASGVLVRISGTDPRFGVWEHAAFLPDPLPTEMPALASETYLSIANARAALAALDSTAAQLENATLLRRPTLRREAQSTSALEGTFAPLSDVLTADEQNPGDLNIKEILNYVAMADHAYDSVLEGRPLSVGMLCELQALLMQGTPQQGRDTGQLRSAQVVIGQREGVPRDMAPIYASRFVPAPPGEDLSARVHDLVDWMNVGHRGRLDPVAESGMAHYQFEALHPFHDGNGRIGRLLMTVQLLQTKLLGEPTLTVSPWFEARRGEYYDRLLAVSTESDWDGWLRFYADGLEASALDTRSQLENLVKVRRALNDIIRSSTLRAGTAFSLVDYAVAHPSFTVRDVERDLGVSYGRANRLVEQLVDLEVLQPLHVAATYARRFYAPRVLDVLVS